LGLVQHYPRFYNIQGPSQIRVAKRKIRSSCDSFDQIRRNYRFSKSRLVNVPIE
jgi:hypothetical protein